MVQGDKPVKITDEGEIDIDTAVTQTPSLKPEDVDPNFYDRMKEIDHRAKVREAKLTQDAQRMSDELNFDDLTKGLADFEQIGSAKGIKKVVKKKKKKVSSVAKEEKEIKGEI